MKKIIAFLIFAVITVQFVFADTAVVDGVTWYYSTYSDGGKTYARIISSVDKYSGNLTVPSSLDGYQVRIIGNNAFNSCTGLTGITLPSGIQKIENYAFENCTGLLSVSLADTLTHIGDYAFAGCTGLQNILLVNTLKYIGRNAFADCSCLVNIVIPDSVTGIGNYLFQNCLALESVVLSQGLISIPDYCFDGCSSLREITFFAELRSIGRCAFRNCNIMADVSLPEGLTTIGAYAFQNCDTFSCINFPSTVESIGEHVVCECDNVKTITVASGNQIIKVVNNCLVSYSGSTLLAVPYGCSTVNIPQGVTDIPAGMFYKDYKLVDLTIPQGVTSIGERAFSYCRNLHNIVIPEGVTRIRGASFIGCSSIEEIVFPSTLTILATDEGAYVSGRYPKTCYDYYDMDSLKTVKFTGPVPTGIDCCGFFYESKVSILFSREFGGEWQTAISNLNRFNGFFQPNKPEMEYVSVAVRENDPTILDVAYRVKSVKPTIKVMALAFKDGVRSFSNVVRPMTLIEGTDVNVGNEISPNVEHKLTWRVSSDCDSQIDFAKMKFEILAVEEDLLPLELVTIPANGSNKAMEISWNAITNEQVFDALLWLYACKTPGLTLENGVLKETDNIVAYGTTISTDSGRLRKNINGTTDYYYFKMAPEYIFSKMGFSLLSGDTLAYANAMVRLNLSPNGVRQYAYRWIEAQ